MKVVKYTALIKPYFSKMDGGQIAEIFLSCFQDGKIYAYNEPDEDYIFMSDSNELPLEVYQKAYEYYQNEDKETYITDDDKYILYFEH